MWNSTSERSLNEKYERQHLRFSKFFRPQLIFYRNYKINNKRMHTSLCQNMMPKRRLWYLPMKLPHELSPLPGSVFQHTQIRKICFRNRAIRKVCHQIIWTHWIWCFWNYYVSKKHYQPVSDWWNKLWLLHSPKLTLVLHRTTNLLMVFDWKLFDSCAMSI